MNGPESESVAGVDELFGSPWIEVRAGLYREDENGFSALRQLIRLRDIAQYVDRVMWARRHARARPHTGLVHDTDGSPIDRDSIGWTGPDTRQAGDALIVDLETQRSLCGPCVDLGGTPTEGLATMPPADDLCQ